MDYKIEKNVPIPVSRMVRVKPERHYGKVHEFLVKLDIGDSFVVPKETVIDALNQFYNPANRMGIRITTRKEDNGVRVWRIA